MQEAQRTTETGKGTEPGGVDVQVTVSKLLSLVRGRVGSGEMWLMQEDGWQWREAGRGWASGPVV